MNILKINKVKKHIKSKPILNNISLTIPQGSITGLIGPSGSGKTTLLRCINRLIDIDSGQIIYKNININSINPIKLRREIGFVHQESVMLPGTVYDNIAYGLQLQEKENRDNITQSMNHAGISETYLTQQASTLSGGEKKRVALARALALQPTILLLDEPTSGVDPKKVQTVEQNILSFTQNLGLTVLLVTHNIEQAKRVSTHIANLKDGTILTQTKAKDFKWEGAY
jgi:ABC-type phosphate transport system ATPase subunit